MIRNSKECLSGDLLTAQTITTKDQSVIMSAVWDTNTLVQESLHPKYNKKIIRYFFLPQIRLVLVRDGHAGQGTGRDRKHGIILNFSHRPFPSRDEVLILRPRPQRPGTPQICALSPYLIEKIKKAKK